MKVIWTIDAGGLYVGSNSVSWAGGAGLSAASAAFFPAFNSIAVGKLSAFGPFPSPNQPAKNIGISSVVGFTGAVPASDPSSTNYLGAGTYTVGTIVFNTSGASGSFSISSFLVTGFDDFYDSNNQLLAPVLNGATLNVVPEPGTASLLGLGLMGLMAASRRRRNA